MMRPTPSKLPEVKFNKTGYEIRTDILKEASALVALDFSYKWAGWEMTAKRDEAGKLVSTVNMPVFPGLSEVLATAEKLYEFVNQTSTK